jgi:hypothetical protein
MFVARWQIDARFGHKQKSSTLRNVGCARLAARPAPTRWT